MADATPTYNKLLADLLALAGSTGGMVTIQRQAACWMSRNSYGTPWWVHWGGTGRGNDVTRTQIEWSMVYRSFGRVLAGPTPAEVLAHLGLTPPLEGAPDRAKDGLTRITLFHHDALLASNGSHGDGLVLATMARPSCGHTYDERTLPHLATDPAGLLTASVFA